MPNQYLTPDVISLLADEMVVEFFEQGDLTSTSRVPEIADKVQERLREEGVYFEGGRIWSAG